MKRAAILQPGYIPWLGFFEQMSKSDVFVYLDDVQYTKNDWRNRNRIKTKEGIQWLTVPVSFEFGQQIREARINNSFPWNKKHLQALRGWYSKSAFYEKYNEELEGILSKSWIYLVDLDVEVTQWLVNKLNLKIETVLASDLAISTEDKQLRIIEICKKLECSHFYEGKSGQSYIDKDLFDSHGIMVEYQEYGHPYYNQLWVREQGFVSYLSIIDLLFNYGPDSLAILTGKKTVAKPEGMTMRHADSFKKL